MLSDTLHDRTRCTIAFTRSRLGDDFLHLLLGRHGCTVVGGSGGDDARPGVWFHEGVAWGCDRLREVMEASSRSDANARVFANATTEHEELWHSRLTVTGMNIDGKCFSMASCTDDQM